MAAMITLGLMRPNPLHFDSTIACSLYIQCACSHQLDCQGQLIWSLFLLQEIAKHCDQDPMCQAFSYITNSSTLPVTRSDPPCLTAAVWQSVPTSSIAEQQVQL